MANEKEVDRNLYQSIGLTCREFHKKLLRSRPMRPKTLSLFLRLPVFRRSRLLTRAGWGWRRIQLYKSYDVDGKKAWSSINYSIFSWIRSCIYKSVSKPPHVGNVYYNCLSQHTTESWARICKRLRSPEIDSKKSIPPGWESIPGFLKRFTNLGSDNPCVVPWPPTLSNCSHICNRARICKLKSLQIRALEGTTPFLYRNIPQGSFKGTVAWDGF